MSSSSSPSALLIRRVRMELGQDAGHGIAVELSDGQIVMAIRATLDLYNRYFPEKSIQSFTCPKGSSRHTPDPAIRGITHLSIQDSRTPQIANHEIFSPFVGMHHIIGYGSAGGFGNNGLEAPRRFANYMEWQRGAREVFSLMPGYFFDESKNLLLIYSPLDDALVTVHGVIDLDMAWDEEFLWDEEEVEKKGVPSQFSTVRLDRTLKNLPSNHMRWIRDGSFFKAKMVLGRMLRKYDKVPTIDGDSVSLDGNALYEEGKEDWDALKEQIRMAEPEPSPIYG